MIRPHIICHMMISIDGRIDCEMTAKISGVKEYYDSLKALNVQATVSGRVTAQLELAQDGEFVSKKEEIFGREGFSKKCDSDNYCVVVDTKGSLLWTHPKELNQPLIVITTMSVKKDYLDYLDSERISWIAVGEKQIDLVHACEILAREFGIERMAIVGGGHINAGFLREGLLDEVSLVVDPAIDGRAGMTALFDGLDAQKEPTPLKLETVNRYNDVLHLLYKLA